MKDYKAKYQKTQQEKPNFDNITDEQIAYGIQCYEREITRLKLLDRRLTGKEANYLEMAESKVKEARAELKRRSQSIKQGKLF